MAQRYTLPLSLTRMAMDLCPECGVRAERHAEEATVLGMFASCNLLRRGVTDRIAQYRADLTTTPAKDTP